MEFCPKCGTVMFPKGDCFQCSCGYQKKITEETLSKYEVSEKVAPKENVIVTGETLIPALCTRSELRIFRYVLPVASPRVPIFAAISTPINPLLLPEIVIVY